MQASTTTAAADAADEQFRSWAPWWHTLLLVGFILMTSWLTARTVGSGAAGKLPRTAYYFQNIVFEWFIVLYVWWGLRLRNRGIGEAIGRTWRGADDALLDFAIAAAFWLASGGALVLLQKAMGLATKEAVKEHDRSLAFLTPRSGRELAMFIALALSAGICEEIMFRGYLQQQFIAATRRPMIGIVLSAVLFGLAHRYQGNKMMIVLGCYGAMFGLLAYFRRSIIPGAIAHGAQDSLAGLVLHFSKYLPLPK